jgi:hypothetical protein
MSAPRMVAFTGPTLESEALHDALGIQAAACRILGPAQQGDVVRACRLGAGIILLIDGYFQSVPAVWHKEILWALSRGVHVVGAASMGALRAAELQTFGMIGIGSIFESFRDGTLDRDDEVAVAHCAAEYGYRSISEALVNVRATVSAAESAGVLSAAEAATVVQRTAAMYYPDRNWSAILGETRTALGENVADKFKEFLRASGRVDQKRADALALVDYVRPLDGMLGRPPQVTFTLQHTVWFDKLHRAAGEFVPVEAPTYGAAPADARRPPTVADAEIGTALSDVTDELRLARRYRHILRTALLRRLATDEAERLGVQLGCEEIARHANDVCRDLGIPDQAQFEQWLVQNGLTLARFNTLVETELRSSIVLSDVHRAVQADLADVLRMAGMWPAVSQRAARKVELLKKAGLVDPGFEDTPFTNEAELAAWWAKRFPSSSSPTADIESLARSADFADTVSFIQVLLREYCAQSLGLEPLSDGGFSS